MTTAQIELIKRLVAAERYYWKAKSDGTPYVEERWRMVEVGRWAGIDPRTVRALEDAGLVEEWIDGKQWWICLKREDDRS